MHRFGFIKDNVRRQLRRIDFHLDKSLHDSLLLDGCINEAVECLVIPDEMQKKILYDFHGKKPLARVTSTAAKLSLRLVNANIVAAYATKPDSREPLVRALKVLLSETVRYRVYKLDVKSFYESFDLTETIGLIRSNTLLTDPARRVLGAILDNHEKLGLKGLPRGLVLSGSLSNALMKDFDRWLSSHEDVFFYRRYVDDITIITSSRESVIDFIKSVEGELPSGLKFKKIKNDFIDLSAFRPKEKDKAGVITKYKAFDYLGYRFHVASEGHQPSASPVRHVWLDIADSKVRRIKTRLVKSYLDYLSTGDFILLEKRVKHLTSNIALVDRATGLRRLSGIHYSYPLVDVQKSRALRSLDGFLKTSINSGSGSIFSSLQKKLTNGQKAKLSSYSFYSGAKNRRFYSFSVKELSRIQGCWKYV